MIKLKSRLLAGCTVLALAHGAAFAQVTEVEFDIDAQELGAALNEFGLQSGKEILFVEAEAAGKTTTGVEGVYAPEDALKILLDASGIGYRVNEMGTVLVGTVAKRGASLDGPVQVAQLETRDTASQTDVVEERSERDDRGEQKPDEIVVTGTNIRGVAPDSSPYYEFDREDIDKTGFGTVSEFVQSLPQNFGGGSNADVRASLPNDVAGSQNFASGSSVNLRGLGSGSTLVLLDGRRLAPTGFIGDFVDISMIPLSAVDRVEVLTDGASAIYGADAIAGVVNFVLRDDYDGAETFGRFGTVTEGNLLEYRAGQTFGKSWDSGNALVSYEFFHRDNLAAADKDFSSSTPTTRDLLPEQESQNILVTGSQQLTEHITLRGHGTYSQRDASSDDTTLAGEARFLASTTEQYGGTAGADIELWGDWLLAVSGGYHKVTEFIARTGLVTLDRETNSDLWSVDGKADGSVFQLPGGAAKLAVGLSYREETFSNLLDGPTVTVAQDDRNVFGVFAEAFIPIVGPNNRVQGLERLELTVAGRYDDYSDFGDTLNPKVGLLWSPLDGLNFRGTYSTSFNPPNLGDTGEAGGNVFVFNVPNPASPTGTALTIIDFRANPALGPEESTAFTAGFDSQWNIGLGSLDISMTWFDIDYKDRIGLAGSAFSFLTDPIVFADVIIPDPDPSVTAAVIASAGRFVNLSPATWMMPGDEDFILDGRLLNLAKADTTGLDFSVAYGIDYDNFGQIDLGMSGTYLFKQEKQITSNAPVFDVVDTVFNPIDLRLRGSASWSRDGISASVFVNYTDSYVDIRNILGTGDVPVDSWTTVDINLSYDTEDRTGNRWLDNTKVSLSVLNLFNEDPPVIEIAAFGSPDGFDVTNGDPLGRFISFQVTKAW